MSKLNWISFTFQVSYISYLAAFEKGKLLNDLKEKVEKELLTAVFSDFPLQ